MPAQANANVVALQLEKVRDKVPLLYVNGTTFCSPWIQQRGDVEKVSSRNRAPDGALLFDSGTDQGTRRGNQSC